MRDYNESYAKSIERIRGSVGWKILADVVLVALIVGFGMLMNAVAA